MSASCFHCGADAALLCDGILGWRRDWYQRDEHAARFDRGFKADGWWVIRGGLDCDGEVMVTCDRPLCARCTTRTSVTFFCGEEGAVETTDLCRDCVAMEERRRVERKTAPRDPLAPLPGYPPVLDDESLDALRARRQLRRLP